jgi:cytochrome oxidase Cu insertion factor (SCO1/SenC/PrrC family)
MHLPRFIAAVSVACTVLASPAVIAVQPAASSRTPVDVSTLGPQVGEPVPDFTLADQHGKPWTLSSVMGRTAR